MCSWQMKGCPCCFQSAVIRQHIPYPDKGCIQTALREHEGTRPGKSSLALIICCGEGLSIQICTVITCMLHCVLMVTTIILWQTTIIVWSWKWIQGKKKCAGMRGRGVRGKRDLPCCFYYRPWQLLGGRRGCKDCCCGWPGLLLDLLAIPPMLCSVAVSGVMLPAVPDLHKTPKKKGTDMERSCPTPSALRRASLPGGSCTRGAPTAAAERHRCWTRAGTYVCAGKEDLRCCFYHRSWQLHGWRLG